MVKEGYNNFYAGADYGLSKEYFDADMSIGKNSEYMSSGFSDAFYPSVRTQASAIGFNTDPRTANQAPETSKKINVGAKTIEVSGINLGGGDMDIIDNIPKQQFREIDRLRKLTGVDLTFHGPLVEPSGLVKQGWTERDRQEAERKIWSAVERGHLMKPDGNIVITFHSSVTVPEAERRVMDPETKKEFISDFYTFSLADGRAGPQKLSPDFFKSEENFSSLSLEEQKLKIKKSMSEQNKESWFRQLQGVSYHAEIGKSHITDILNSLGSDSKNLLTVYEKYLSGEFKPFSDELKIPREVMEKITHADLYLRDSYAQLQNLFNQAYEVAEKNNDENSKVKLKDFQKKVKPLIGSIESPSKLDEFANVIVQGVNVLRSITPPQNLMHLKDFELDKASETFANVAYKSYSSFKDNSPIISIENPPAGTTGLSRASDLRELVEKSREKFKQKILKEGNLSPEQAEEQAKKLIGVTWDVGHINMIREAGYSHEDLRKEAKEIAPFVKHIHLSDNFGLSHTELPMGMGNVPLQAHMEELRKAHGDQLQKIKQIVEVGPWYQHFKSTPMRETLRATGSPIYSADMGVYWNQALNSSGGYYGGMGPVLPEQHFNTYGSGFSTLPLELGGQMSGKSRVSGNPME